jgi:ABC-type transport system involved in multi-copper enzyme maturation permease subunit
MLTIRRYKPHLLIVLGVLFMLLVYGIQFGWVNANDPIAVPIAIAFVVVLLLVLMA